MLFSRYLYLNSARNVLMESDSRLAWLSKSDSNSFASDTTISSSLLGLVLETSSSIESKSAIGSSSELFFYFIVRDGFQLANSTDFLSSISYSPNFSLRPKVVCSLSRSLIPTSMLTGTLPIANKSIAVIRSSEWPGKSLITLLLFTKISLSAVTTFFIGLARTPIFLHRQLDIRFGPAPVSRSAIRFSAYT